MIKYGELSTKKDNINAFLKQLKKNVEFALKDLDAIVSFDKGRMFVETKEFDKVIDKLHYVAGIHEYNIVYKMDYDEDIDLLGRKIMALVLLELLLKEVIKSILYNLWKLVELLGL